MTMKWLRISIVALFLPLVLLANDNPTRDEVLALLKNYVQTGQYDLAKETYESHITLFADNGAYEWCASYYYAMALWGNLDYKGSYDAILHAVSILDANYEDVVSSKEINYIMTYYHHAFISQQTNIGDPLSLYRKAKKAFEDAGLADIELYYKICDELSSIESTKDYDRIERLGQSALKDIESQKFDEALSKINKGLSLIYSMPTPSEKMLATYLWAKGRMAWAIGDMNVAEQAYTEATKHLGDYEGAKDLSTKLMIDIGTLYGAIKDFDNSNAILQSVKQQLETEGDLGYEYARTLGNLAIVSIGKGKRLEASIYLETAIDILSGIDTVNKSEIATLYSSAAMCYDEMGNLGEAIAAALKAKEYLSGIVLPITTAQVENNLGCMYLKQQDYTKAEQAFITAADYSNGTPLNPMVKCNLALIQFVTNNNHLSETASHNSEELKSEVLSSFLFLADTQRFNYWGQTGGLLSVYNRLLKDSEIGKYSGTIYNNALFSKGLLLRTSNWLTQQISSSATQNNSETYHQLSEYNHRISNGTIPPDSVEFYRLSAMRLEKELLRDNITYSALCNNLMCDWKDIRKALKNGEVAIEFVQLPIIENNLFNGKNEYAAIIINSDSKFPEIVSICHEDSILTLLEMPSQLLRINDETKRNEHYRAYLYGNGTYRYATGTRRNRIETVGQRLYDIVWGSVVPFLGSSVQTIYYSPIGILNSISFAALTNHDSCLDETFDLRLLSSTAEIIRLNQTKKQLIKNSVVYGGIQYDVDADSLIAESRSYTLSDAYASRGLSLPESERSGWQFLNGSITETSIISKRLMNENIESQLLTGIAANEESFKSLSGHSPELIHIATHGFFLSDKKDIDNSQYLKALNAPIQSNGLSMNHSGLLFAGANRAWSGKDVIENIEDGILTADEISRLNLNGTDLVVLSACETGLGEDASMEGVFGLQRGFKLAGVNTLVMSLWKVPDEATSELMQLFYDKWLEGMERHKAFSLAQNMIKEKYPNPYYWAGFVMFD